MGRSTARTSAANSARFWAARDSRGNAAAPRIDAGAMSEVLMVLAGPYQPTASAGATFDSTIASTYGWTLIATIIETRALPPTNTSRTVSLEKLSGPTSTRW